MRSAARRGSARQIHSEEVSESGVLVVSWNDKSLATGKLITFSNVRIG